MVQCSSSATEMLKRKTVATEPEGILFPWQRGLSSHITQFVTLGIFTLGWRMPWSVSVSTWGGVTPGNNLTHTHTHTHTKSVIPILLLTETSYHHGDLKLERKRSVMFVEVYCIAKRLCLCGLADVFIVECFVFNAAPLYHRQCPWLSPNYAWSTVMIYSGAVIFWHLSVVTDVIHVNNSCSPKEANWLHWSIFILLCELIECLYGV